VAVKDGKIVAGGARVDVEKAHQGAATRVVDLAGRTLVPGFVDGHVHFLGLGSQAVGANLLAPTDGPVNTIDDLVAQLQEFAKGPDVGGPRCWSVQTGILVIPGSPGGEFQNQAVNRELVQADPRHYGYRPGKHVCALACDLRIGRGLRAGFPARVDEAIQV